MTPSFNSTLSNLLLTATTKLDWCSKFESAFNGSLRIRMFHDTASNAVDATVSGVEFYNASVTGAFIVSGNNITSFGKVSSASIQQSANLLTGTSLMVLEGNGSRAVFSLGLTRGLQTKLGVAASDLKDFDYSLFAQPVASGGLGFTLGTGIKAPVFLNSGVGPGAPELDADAPAFYQVYTYPTDNTDATRVGMGVKAINVRDLNLSFDRPFIATQIGDVRRMRSAAGDGTVFGTGGDSFRIAPLLLVVDKSLNADNSTKPVYKLRFNCKPEGRWASYPFRPDFNYSTDTIATQAFKVVLYRADLSILDVIEHYPSRVNNVPGSAKPINYFGQTANDSATTPSTTQPTEPWWNCFMTLAWQSAAFKPSKYLNDLHPGIEPAGMDPQEVKNYDAWPDDWPIFTGNQHANGLMSWRVCPKWPRTPGSGLDTTIIDQVYVGLANDGYRTQAIGYGYYPGANQQHTWYMSPGGSRHDRNMWSHGTVRWLTDPNGIRVHGAVPNSTLMYHWNLGYHNEGGHYFKNVELNQTINKDDLLYGNLAYNDTYYNGGNENFRDPSVMIRLLASGNKVGNNPYRDKNGRVFTNEFERDYLHNIPDAAQVVYFSNDPMGAYESRDSLNSSILCAWEMSRSFSENDFLTRAHAWYFKHLVEAWVVANNDPNCLSSSEAEFMLIRHLSFMVDTMKPKLANPQNFTQIATRDLGLQCNIYYAASGTGASIGVYDGKAYYFSNILMFAKQTGCIDRIRAISAKGAEGIDMIINGLAKGSIDYYLATKGALDNRAEFFIPFDTANPPAKFSWDMYTPNGLQDFIHKPDGTIDGNYIEGDGMNTMHNRAVFLWILKYFYPEYTFPKLDDAITLMRGFYNTIEARKNSGLNTWHWKFANMSIPLQPSHIGAPILR